MRRQFAALTVIPIALAASGCGKTTIDAHKAEGFLGTAIHPPPRSVACPSEVRVTRGATFTCQVVTAGGARASVTLHVVDGKGRVGVSPGDVRAR